MPWIVTSVHDPLALAATCLRLGLPPPVERAIHLDGEEVFGWVVRLPGVRFPIVCATLTGLIAYHRLDNAHDRYAQIMNFIHCYYDLRAKRRQGDSGTALPKPRPVPTRETA